MNNLSDPREAAYFDQNLGAGIYEGGPYGENTSYFRESDIVMNPTNPA
jgi:hypothetical protein